MKWEYAMHNSPITDPPANNLELDDWGERGWELAAIFSDGRYYHYIFTRPKDEHAKTEGVRPI